MGFENPGLGLPNSDMEELMRLLADALARGVIVAFLLPDNPNVGREFTDEGLKFLGSLLHMPLRTGALQAYTLCSSLQEQDQPSIAQFMFMLRQRSWMITGSR